MNPVFADTAFWIALSNVKDVSHGIAQRFKLSLARTTILTSESVLAEYLNYFAGWGPNFRSKVSDNVLAILNGETNVDTAPHTRETFLDGLKLYRNRLDKGYSLTDCISMRIMRREGLTEILTGDRHFEQEGFRALFHP